MKQFLDGIDGLAAVVADDLRRDEWIEDKALHVKPQGECTENAEANAASANQANRVAGYFARGFFAGVTPAAGSDQTVAFGDLLQEGESGGDGEFGHGGRIGLRRDADRDPAACGVLDVNAVEADAVLLDVAQVGGGVDDGSGDRSDAYHDGSGRGHCFENGLLGGALRADDRGELFKIIDAALMNRLSDEHGWALGCGHAGNGSMGGRAGRSTR